jgi:flagellar biosynthesis protein FlhF
MKVKTFTAPDMRTALAAARVAMGEDIVIVRTRGPAETESRQYEITAALADEMNALRRQIEPAAEIMFGGASALKIALVGPAGAGKTTTLIKLALHAQAFGAKQVGLVSLDTYRIAGLDEIHTYGDITGLPVEIVYNPQDCSSAQQRLAKCDVVLIDTPGRPDQGHEWLQLLRAFRPHETHLVLPAVLRIDVARGMTKTFAGCAPTHQLLTRLDEVPGEAGIAALASTIGLPARWVSTGRNVPDDLRPAASRILSSVAANGAAA